MNIVHTVGVEEKKTKRSVKIVGIDQHLLTLVKNVIIVVFTMISEEITVENVEE